MIVLTPLDDTTYNHYSLLKAVQLNWNLGGQGRRDETAIPLKDLPTLPNAPPPGPVSPPSAGQEPFFNNRSFAFLIAATLFIGLVALVIFFQRFIGEKISNLLGKSSPAPEAVALEVESESESGSAGINLSDLSSSQDSSDDGNHTLN
jgi:hypothetical protein